MNVICIPCHSRHRKVEWFEWEASIIHEANQEASQASINMDRDAVTLSKLSDALNVINATVGELRRGSYQHAR